MLRSHLTAALLLGLWLVCGGCARREATTAQFRHQQQSAGRRRGRTQTQRRGPRTRAAAVTIRFSNSGVEPGSTRLGYDRLRVSAIFADTDRRDIHLLGDLVGRALRGPKIQREDSCVRTPGPWLGGTTRPGPAPQAWLQLLDVGNLRLDSGAQQLGLHISLVPSLFSAVRGVRYDADIDHSRAWLAAPSLRLSATGGDGVPAFQARIKVPRPVRLTHVGRQRVRTGLVTVGQVGAEPPQRNLSLRWGSVDGDADLEVLVGSEQGDGVDWLRCRLHDDGDFTVPAVLLSTLPKRSARHPWLVVLVRSHSAQIPGFPGRPLVLELVDSVRVH